MKTYMELVAKYQQANPRKTWLTIFSVALSVALVTTIFSMMDVFQRTVKIQTINETGNYHSDGKRCDGGRKGGHPQPGGCAERRGMDCL